MPNGPPPAHVSVVPGQGWVDLLARLVVQVGFPVVVAGILLYFILFKWTETAVQNAAALQHVQATNDEILQGLEAQHQLLQRLEESQHQLTERQQRGGVP
jgi:hypothetical protein